MKITGCIQPVYNINYNKFKKKKAVREEVKPSINVFQNTKENNEFSKYSVNPVRAGNRSKGKGVELENSSEELDLMKEHRQLGESVCLIVTPFQRGTGFVLFDNFILTNAHLFEKCVEYGNLKDDIEVKVFFNFEKQVNNGHYFLAHRNICYRYDDLDYAILKLKQKDYIETEKKVPPGLLESFGPKPESGEVVIIGHPGGGVKQYDRTSIIEKENREKAVEDQLEPYKDTLFTLYSIHNLIKNQGIESIYVGGNKADKVITYKTFMYHGSSGSPVFDAQCKVFGLHTSGYVYGYPKDTKGVIEWAQPLLTIFEDFVIKLREDGDEELLKRVQKVAKRNPDLNNILKKILNPDSDEPMEID